MDLRPYQLEVVEKTEAGWESFSKQLVVLPTGGGKTIVFSHLAARRQPERTLILAHREELIDQAIAKLHAATGIRADKEKAEDYASLTAPVVVASVQSMIRRLDRWPRDHFGLVVADEAHHAISDSWQKVLRHFDGEADVLGVTATPDRGDKRNLGVYFENVPAEVKLFDLINAGYLSRIRMKALPLRIDLNQVKSVAGDFADGDLGAALDPYLDQIAEMIRDHASFRRTLVFLPLIATSHKFVEACRKVGLSAMHVDGESDDRRGILDRFAAWEFDVLANAMLLTEGFDDPGIDCVVNLRPTRSRSLYSQIIGRGTRTADTKQDLLLLDFLWQHKTHNIIKPAHLIAGSDEEAEAISATVEEKAEAMPTDVAEQMPLDLQDLATEAQAKREEALRKRLEENRKKQATVMSADEFAAAHDSIALAEYEPVMPWESLDITEGQARVLKRAKIEVESVRGRGHASKLIDIIFSERKLKAATPGQIAMMRRMRWRSQDGVRGPEEATAHDAAEFFRGLKKPKRQQEAELPLA